ncbi:hypothetical protein BDV93DRAFT_514898 [Ceratobasidium sp. AG-I]|nr:hypothetical protein BDV93DRAFT_514898 [Ceratobasidium sp. AG-I]
MAVVEHRISSPTTAFAGDTGAKPHHLHSYSTDEEGRRGRLRFCFVFFIIEQRHRALVARLYVSALLWKCPGSWLMARTKQRTGNPGAGFNRNNGGKDRKSTGGRASHADMKGGQSSFDENDESAQLYKLRARLALSTIPQLLGKKSRLAKKRTMPDINLEPGDTGRAWEGACCHGVLKNHIYKAL